MKTVFLGLVLMVFGSMMLASLINGKTLDPRVQEIAAGVVSASGVILVVAGQVRRK